MANDAAWQAGVDIAMGRKGKKKDDSDKPDEAKAGASKSASGGLGGLEKKGFAKLFGKKKQATPAAGTTAGAAELVSGIPRQEFLPGTLIPKGKHGGRIKKTGLVYAHRGELIIPAKRQGKKASSKRTITKA